MTRELRVAIKAVMEAGTLLQSKYGRVRAKYKSDGSIVTAADVESERLIRSILKGSFPDDAFLGEEMGHREGRTGRMWAIDPLDGSTNYSIHNPFFSVSIALLARDEVLLGVVYYPCQKELFSAERGWGARLNGGKIGVSDNGEMGRSMLTFCHGRDRASILEISRIFGKMKAVTVKTRQMGAASLELCYVACGRVDAFVMIGVSIWDVAAGMLIVKESGGMVTDAMGNDFTSSSSVLLASNGKLHRRLLRLLSA